jgi:kinetochore protein NDC80
MVSHLQLDYKLNGKLEEEVPRVLKALGYPVTISHSHMRTIGVPSTWVVLLGALSYLRTVIEVNEFCYLIAWNLFK